MAELSRKERERARHHTLILEAAEAVFAQKGFHSATVQEIAERAEFSVGYIYNQFEHKADIYAELMEMRAAQFMDDVEERLRRQEDPVQKVRAAIAAKVDFFEQHQQFFLVLAHATAGEGGEGPAAQPEKCRRRYADYVARLADIFADGSRRGLFIDVDPLVLVHCLEGMTNSAIAHWVHSGGKEGGLAAPEVMERVLFEGILVERDR